MSGTDSPAIYFPPPLLFVTALVAGILVDGNVLRVRHPFHLSQYAGIAVLLVGLALIAATLGLFRRHRTRPEPWQPASTLIAAGLYRWSRNPMYLGMAVAAAGVAVFFEGIVALVFLTIVIVILDRVVIAREEAYLLRRFGDDYEAYRRQVRRWL